jgi:hypothetical protein
MVGKYIHPSAMFATIYVHVFELNNVTAKIIRSLKIKEFEFICDTYKYDHVTSHVA